MKAAVALRTALLSVSRQVGIEGAFLLIGTACLAIVAEHYASDGSWFVVGVISLLIGLVLAQPRKP